MKIASISEDKNIEKRVAITPETAKKYIDNGFQVVINRNYGDHLGYDEKEYDTLGVSILDDDKEVIKSSDILVQLGLPKEDKTSLLKEGQIVIGVLDPFQIKIS